jgi:hypothetical protein
MLQTSLRISAPRGKSAESSQDSCSLSGHFRKLGRRDAPSPKTSYPLVSTSKRKLKGICMIVDALRSQRHPPWMPLNCLHSPNTGPTHDSSWRSRIHESSLKLIIRLYKIYVGLSRMTSALPSHSASPWAKARRTMAMV